MKRSRSLKTETIAGYAVHPAASLFPIIPEAEMAELAKDIQQHGLLHPIILHEGKVLDGRNRLLACEIAKEDPRFEKWAGTGSPTQWVMSQNFHRRQLTQSQRAAIATEMLPLLEAEAKAKKEQNKSREGKFAPMVDAGGKSTEKAAESAHVSPRIIADAKAIKKKSPKKFAAILAGTKTVNQAKGEIKKAATPRGGLFAAAQEAKNEPTLPTIAQPKPRLADGHKAIVRATIEVWWNTTRGAMELYPATAPGVMVEKIIALFS